MSRIIALCYLRRSGRDAKEISIEIQRDECVRFCHERGWVPRVFEEGEDTPGQYSARKRDNLKVWANLWEIAMTDDTVVAIVAYDLARAFRRTETALFAAEDLRKNGVQLVFVNGGLFDTSTPETKFRATLEAAITEYESFKSSARLLAHYRKVKESYGYAGHRPMFGLDRTGSATDHTVHWVPDENFPHLLYLFRLYATGEYGIYSLAQKLNAEGIYLRDRSNNPTPPHSHTIRYILQRAEFYAPFVNDDTLIRRVVQIREARSNHNANHRAMTYPALLLRGVLFCECGASYQTKHWIKTLAHGKQGVYAAYRHRSPTDCKNKLTLKPHEIERLFFVEIERIGDLSDKEIELLLGGEPEKIVRDPHETERGKLLKRLEKYEEMLADGLMTADRYLAAVEKVKKRLAEIPEKKPLPPKKRKVWTAEQFRTEIESLAMLFAIGRELEPDLANRAIHDIVSRVIYKFDASITIQMLST